MMYRGTWRRVVIGALSEILFLTTNFAQTESVDFSGSSPSDNSIIDLDPVVVSASRYEEELLSAPAAVTVLHSTELAREAVSSVAALFRKVPGVDYQQAGINRFLIAVRGFNNAFASSTYVMVDNRDAYNPALALVDYTRLPIDALDLERVEIVRGPGSAVYGPGVEQGVIHFITKDPFEYPGSSMAVTLGEQSMRGFSFRQAGIIKEKFAYKFSGSFVEAEDWKLDSEDPHDSVILSHIVREVRDLDGNVARIVEGRDYGSYHLNISGELHYRPDDETRIMAHLDYGKLKEILNASLGEIQIDGSSIVTAQMQYECGPLWIQAYGFKEFVDGDNFFYRAGNLMYGDSYELNLQARSRVDWSSEEEPLIFGFDYKFTNPKSRGTISGRFEDADSFSNAGGYIQGTKHLSDSLDFKGSARVDSVEASGETLFSPRAALVYQPAPEHSFRLTYNHAISRPIASDYFSDLQVESSDSLRIRFLGGSIAYTFPDPPETTSFLGGGRDPGVGMSNRRAFAVLTEGVAANVPSNDPAALQEFLFSKIPQIDGLAEGIMTLRSDTNELLGVVQTLKGTEPVHLPKTDTVEIGYKGYWQDRIMVGIDLYYTRKQNYIFAKVLTPFVEVPADTLAASLEQAVRKAISNEEVTPFGTDLETLAFAYSQASAAIADRPMGILEPEQNYNPDTIPEMVMVNINTGELDYFGADLSVEASFDRDWSAFANYSWVSENFFDEEALGVPGTGFVVTMNAPQHKFRAGLTYYSPRGFTVSGSVRYLGSFEVRDGRHYNGTVESYTLFDLGLSYDFSGAASGLHLAITAQNIFDKIHREYIGFPKIGRLVSARLSYSF